MKQKHKAAMRKYLPVLILTVVGAVGGYLYYRFVGCAGETCTITSNPILSSVYGGLIGGLIGSVFVPAKCCACETNKCKEDQHE